MKRVLIISPYFPPNNAADMHRIRMSLPFFKDFNWEAEIVTVDPRYCDLAKDDLLFQTIPSDTSVHMVEALSKRWTSKFGLGSIALRSLFFFYKKVNQLLKQRKFDLIYFSTTQFPVCVLGAYWKKRFRIPYIIDMQDPWHSEYYKTTPTKQRPPKYWFSYRLNKQLEPIAMRNVDGLIAVSQAYISELKRRYPSIKDIPTSVITFAAFEEDFQVTKRYSRELFPGFTKMSGHIHLVYIGRGGKDLHPSIRVILEGFKKGLIEDKNEFEKMRFHFIGTSYAPAGKGSYTVLPLAKELDLIDYVEEQTDRLSYFRSIRTLQEADILIVPGSDDPRYTASKIFPYILSGRPLLGVFRKSSSTYHIVNDCSAGKMIELYDENAVNDVYKFYKTCIEGKHIVQLDSNQFKNYTARRMTEKQCELFNSVI